MKSEFQVSLAVLFLAAGAVHAAPATLAPAQLRLLMLKKSPALMVLDVRPPDAYAQGHIQGARNVPAQAVTTVVLPKGAKIVVYCGDASCPLSAQAASALSSAGHADVSHLDGGFAAWRAAGYPVVSGGSPTIATPVPARRPRMLLGDARRGLAAGALVPLWRSLGVMS